MFLPFHAVFTTFVGVLFSPLPSFSTEKNDSDRRLRISARAEQLLLGKTMSVPSLRFSLYNADGKGGAKLQLRMPDFFFDTLAEKNDSPLPIKAPSPAVVFTRLSALRPSQHYGQRIQIAGMTLNDFENSLNKLEKAPEALSQTQKIVADFLLSMPLTTLLDPFSPAMRRSLPAKQKKERSLLLAAKAADNKIKPYADNAPSQSASLDIASYRAACAKLLLRSDFNRWNAFYKHAEAEEMTVRAALAYLRNPPKNLKGTAHSYMARRVKAALLKELPILKDALYPGRPRRKNLDQKTPPSPV